MTVQTMADMVVNMAERATSMASVFAQKDSKAKIAD